MDSLTIMIKKNIKLKYSSIKKFSEEIGIPQTTIISAIKNGISGTSFSTVCKICKALDIKLANGIYPIKADEKTINIVDKLSKLDAKGIHTVTTVLEMEYVRCLYEAERITIAEKNAAISYPIISADNIPTKSEVNNLLKALNDDDDALKL